MKRFIIFFLATIGALTISLIVLLFWSSKQLLSEKYGDLEKISHKTILVLRVGKEPLKESPSSSLPFDFTMGLKESMTLKGTLTQLERASNDKHVKGVLLVIEDGSLGLAQTQEIRQALLAFRKKGKIVYAFAETFGELQNGTMAYYLATAADKIWLQPSGTLGLTGLTLEIPFAKDAIAALKIIPRIERREHYKSMPDSVIENDFTPSHRENLQDILENLTKQLITDMATSRHIDVKTMESLINQGPFLGSEGVNHKLIDGIVYLSDVKAEIDATLLKKEKEHSEHHYDTHPHATYIALSAYGRRTAKQKSDKALAFVYIDGAITRTPRSDLDDASEDWGDDVIIKGLRQARQDPDVKAIILRLNTGGGSVIASETIWHEVKEIVKQGKPVIASLGDMAASGGYFIATAASKIVANPATLTGSIGVYSGKFITTGLWDHLGIHWRSISKNDNATMWSSSHDYSDYQHKRLQAIVDEIYDTFQQKVMDGRKMSKEKVHELAKGRVWTGQQSYEKGLVDTLGGITEAIDVAKKELGVAPEETFTLEDFPKTRTPFQKIVRLLSLSEMSSTLWLQIANTFGLAPRSALEVEQLRVKGS